MSLAYDSNKTVVRNMVDALITIANAEVLPFTDVLFVDGDRTDSYTEDGSLTHPYKTVAAAKAASASGDVLVVAPGAYSETVTLTAGTFLFGWNVTGLTLTGEYIIFKGSTIEFSGDLTLENGEILKNDTDGQIDIVANACVKPGTTGGLITKISEATADITATASVTIQVNVPTGCKLVGVQLRVDVALAAGETWDAEWNDGSSMQSICTAAAVAQNTKVNKFHDDNANTPVTDAETDIVVTKNGGGSFTAQGTIRAIAYYQTWEAMGDAS